MFIRRKIYTVIFKFNLIKSRVRVRIKGWFFLLCGDVYYMITHYYYTAHLYWNGLLT